MSIEVAFKFKDISESLGDSESVSNILVYRLRRLTAAFLVLLAAPAGARTIAADLRR
jgi:hypothetical protein